MDEERRAAFEEDASHFESSYHVTLLYLPPEESTAHAAGCSMTTTGLKAWIGVSDSKPSCPGVLHRDPLAKYAVAFRRTSTSSFASANSLRRRLFSASSSLTGRRS